MKVLNRNMNEGEIIQRGRGYKYLGSTIEEDKNCSEEIKVRMPIERECFKKKTKLFCGPLNKDLKEKLTKCYVWSVALFTAERWTLSKADENRIEALEIWI